MMAREELALEARDVQRKLGKLAQRLAESNEACKAISLGDPSAEELMRLESLSARFERGIDIFVRTFLRILDTLEGTEGGTIIDVLSRSERRGFIQSADEFYDMRHNRNRIAHEYLDVEALEMASFVRDKTPALLDALRLGTQYNIR
jgi:uncharacterized protein YfbU (UPF0304 family)